jgi:hypothetical protein
MPLSARAKAFIAVLAAIAAACFFVGATHWHPNDLVQFFCYLVLAMVASTLKITLPGSDEVLHCEFATGLNSSLFSSLDIPLGQGLSGWVAQNNKPILNGNPCVEPGYLNDPTKFSTHRSALAVPLDSLLYCVPM